MKYKFSGQLKEFVERATRGNSKDIDFIMKSLRHGSTLVTCKFIDFALSNVSNPVGVERIKYYLFNGTQVQRNYASLYFNRLGEWKIVKTAYSHGLIDGIQAFAR